MTCSKLDDSAINGNGDATTVRLERGADVMPVVNKPENSGLKCLDDQ